MKKLLKLISVAMLLFAVSACESDKESTPGDLDVTYANISGTWKLTSWNGIEQTESPYMYLILDRKEHTFEMYHNMDSGKSQHTSGVYELTMKDERVVVKGMYDFASGFWNHDYYVSGMTADQMTWTITDNANDVSVYTRCAAIPEDVLNGTRAAMSMQMQ